MSWAEFRGEAISVSNSQVTNNTSEGESGLSGLGPYAPSHSSAANKTTPGFQLVPIVGSIVILNFAEQLQLVEDFYAPGSLGSFNLQIAVAIQNYTD